MIPNMPPTSESTSNRKRMVFAIILIIFIGLAVRVWVALQWNSNFCGDEAVFGLMAKDFLAGKFPVYFYSQHYMGSFESLLSALFVKLLGPGIFSIRVAPLLLFCLFFIFYGRWVHQLWGNRVAFFSLLVLVLPGWVILWSQFRSWTNHPSLLFLEMSVLLLSLPLLIGEARFRVWRLAALGLVIGLGLWTHPLMIFCVIFISIVFWLQSPEWAVMHQRLADFAQSRWRISVGKILSCLFFATFCFIILTTFTRNWNPAYIFANVRWVTGGILMIVASGLVLLFYLVSKRRQALLKGSAVSLLGFLLGNLPQWGDWLFYGVRPSLNSYPSSLAELFFRVKLVSLEIFPALLGIPPLFTYDREDTVWSRGLPEAVFWVLALLILSAIIANFFWTNRRVLAGFFTLTPIKKEDRKTLLIILMFILPIAAALLSGNTKDIWAVRYLIFSWQVFAIIFGLFLSSLVSRKRTISSALVLCCVVLLGLLNQRDYARSQVWEKGSFSAETVSELKEYLAENHVKAGYADNHFFFAFTYLLQGEITTANYNWNKSIHDYFKFSEILPAFPVQAYILFHSQTQLPATLPFSDFVRAMREGFGPRPPAFYEVISDLEKRVFLGRRTISNWDVWLVGNPAAVDTSSNARR